MKKSRYNWTTVDSFKVGLSETKVYIKSLSGNLELKLDYNNPIAAHVRDMLDNNKRNELQTYLKYLFSSILLMGDNDFLKKMIEITNEHVNSSMNQKPEAEK